MTRLDWKSWCQKEDHAKSIAKTMASDETSIATPVRVIRGFRGAALKAGY
jgi:hypothetical protein